MQRFKLLLAPAELDALQGLLEFYVATNDHDETRVERDILTKIVVVREESEAPYPFAHQRDESPDAPAF